MPTVQASTQPGSVIQATTQLTPQNKPLDTQSQETKTNLIIPDPKTEQHDPRLQQLADKEKLLVRKELALKRHYAQMEQELKDKLNPPYDPNEWKNKLQKNLVGTLTEAGISYEQLAQTVLQSADPVHPMVQGLQAKIDALETKLGTYEEKINNADTDRYNQALSQIKKDAERFVKQNPDEYEAINSTGSHEAVALWMEERFKTEGYLPDMDEAAAQVESQIIENAKKLSALKKLQTQTPAAIPKPIISPTAITLTNKVTAQTRPRISDRDRVERAKLAFMGKLNG